MTEDRSIAAAMRKAEARLAAAGVDSPGVDARWIAAAAVGGSPTLLTAHAGEGFPDGTRERFEEMISRRERREPLAYIVGTVSFRGLELEVGPGALVPRPETEITAGRAIARARERARGRRPAVVDVGTGCGPIALSVAAEVPEARVFATEIAGAARGWCLRNLARTGLRVTLLPGDLFDPLHPALGAAVDVVVSNPPYLAEAEVPGLPDEVRRFEPREALVAGESGLETIMAMLEEVPLWLSPGGWLVVEISPPQAERVSGVLNMIGYDSIEVTRDLAGRERVVEARWTGVPR